VLAYLLLDFVPWLKRRGADVGRIDADFLAGIFADATDMKQKDAAARLAAACDVTLHWTVKPARNGGESK